MVDTVTGLEVVAKRMRHLGHEVEFVPGWQRRGVGTLRPRAKVNHHTAGGRSGGNSPSLRIVTFGRPDLRNALCNTYSDRRANLYIVAALTAWHAGLGSWRGATGNSTALGHEAENDGVGEPWSPDHLQMLVDLDRIQCEVFGYGVQMVCEHKEWAPTRKIDRAGISGDRWRERVAGDGAPIPADPVDTSSESEQGMYRCKQGDKGPDVELLQLRLAAAGQKIEVDREYGEKTAGAVAEVTKLSGAHVTAKHEHRIEIAVQRAVARAELKKQLDRISPGKHDHTAKVESTVRLT